MPGLFGSLTPTNPLRVTGPSAHLLVNTSCLWNQSRGEVQLEFAPGHGLEDREEAVWSFELRNPDAPSPPANATVRMTAAI